MRVFNNIQRLIFFRSMRPAVLFMLSWLFVPAVFGVKELDDSSQAFLKTYCVRCHDSEKQKGKFRLDNLETDFTNPPIAEKWSEVRFRINAGEMPPDDEMQPTANEIGKLVDVLTLRIREGAAKRMAKRGLLEHYRLSRQEYAHTIYDLLGVVYDVEAPGAFNDDPRLHGFDRIGALLSVAPSHIERYLEAAEAAVAQALPDSEIPTKTDRLLAGEGKRRLLQLGEGWGFDLKHPGRYRLRIRASGLPAFTGRIPRLSIWHRHHKRSFDGVDLVATEDDPAVIELDGLFPAGGYDIRNHAQTLNHANGAYKLFRNQLINATNSVSNLKTRHPSPWTKVVDEKGRPVMPLLLIDWIEIDGPLQPESDLAKRKGLMPADEKDASEIRAKLKQFAERAWRRPVKDAEIEPYTNLIAAEQEAGESFKSAYRSALASVLVSRSFFNLEEGSADEKRARLNDFELASRLSYFLWSSMPDEQLFAAARRGELHKPDTLAQQVDRMIADPKIGRFLESFPKQWLQLHRVGMFQPDPELYPEYEPWLEESMVEETTAYFAEMFTGNLPLREAVDSNWTMLNSRLAIHYEIPGPHPLGLTRVNLGPETRRGGILTQASILSLTSDGTRHRPVHRGAWVSEAILAHTPPSPPPNVDPLEPIVGDKPKTTIRSQLEAHATDPNCVSCHSKIDPLGLAFENFDAIGRWREIERVKGGVGEDPRVNASGTLPDGRTFENTAEFKKLLAGDNRITEAFLEQLATYALRRVMTIDDLDQFHSLVDSIKAGDHRLQSLIRRFTLSRLFKKR
ncbi:MAG: DUF1592 domain-containing protein [Verrucomicrobiota bacterium]|nr:DUF1592 domain-containing protein [Verrucomicrobiota bacterium]